MSRRSRSTCALLFESRFFPEQFVGPLQSLAEETRAVHVTFNNNYQDYSQRNARQLMEMLL